MLFPTESGKRRRKACKTDKTKEKSSDFVNNAVDKDAILLYNFKMLIYIGQGQLKCREQIFAILQLLRM